LPSRRRSSNSRDGRSNQQQLIGLLQDPIGQGFAHLHAGNATHLIVEAFQVLDVDRGEHVDAGGEQFLNILPALFMAAAGRVAVGQFVHQHQLRLGGEQAVQVHFLEHHAPVFTAQQRLLRQATEQRFGLGAAVAAGLAFVGATPVWQWTAFLAVSAILLMSLRRFADHVTHEPPEKVGVDRLIGQDRGRARTG